VAVTRTGRARGEVHLVRLDPTLGSEIQKTRPCLVVSPDELNQYLRTVIIAPMTTGGGAYPWRVPCRFQRRSGFVTLDQLRTVDAERLLSPARSAHTADGYGGPSAPTRDVRGMMRKRTNRSTGPATPAAEH
jgi:mRNA interferase MazF